VLQMAVALSSPAATMLLEEDGLRRSFFRIYEAFGDGFLWANATKRPSLLQAGGGASFAGELLR
jgi:hypothetical protein